MGEEEEEKSFCFNAEKIISEKKKSVLNASEKSLLLPLLLFRPFY